MVLVHLARTPALGRDVHAPARVVEHGAIEDDATLHLVQAGERAQQRCLARAVRSQHRDGLAGGGVQRHVQSEGVALYAHHRFERHSAPSQRSRMPTRIATETTRRMRLSVIAASGFVSVSSARYTAIGTVCVRPGKLPANVIVAPNSPSARAQHSTAPEKMAGRSSGSVTRAKTIPPFAPSALAA